MPSFNDLLALHKRLDDLFLDHQRALLRLDMDRAESALEKYTAELLAHIRDEEERETAPAVLLDTTKFAIAPQTRVDDVLSHYPQSLDIFLKHGFAPLSNPFLRQTMARVVTVEQACRREGVDLNKLLVDLKLLSAGTPVQP